MKIGILATRKGDIFGVHNDLMALASTFGTPVIVSPIHPDASSIDALIMPGGHDIDPLRYTKEWSVHSGPQDRFLEYFDKIHLESFIHRIPILGICRGLQSINVHMGGTLHQDLPHHSIGTEYDLQHKVSFTDRPKVKMSVTSTHHQGIDILADGLRIEAYSEDGVIEAVSGDNIIAVQWHPERMQDVWTKNMFQTLLER